MEEENEFRIMGYEGCVYCKHVVIIELDPRYLVQEEYCYQDRESNGECTRITTNPSEVERMKKRGIKSIDGFVDCDKFESSGIAAHPETLKHLIQFNSKCESIPSDPSAEFNPYNLYPLLLKRL